MGKIEIDHTGANAGITLSSDGTDLLLDGTAIGGGGTALELYAENRTGAFTYTAPSATGDNSVAIGNDAVASGNNNATAIGWKSTASASSAFSVSATVSGSQSIGIGYLATVTAGQAVGIGPQASAGATSSTAIGRYATTVSGSYAMALSRSYASGADSFAAAIGNNASSYGATGANSVAMGQQAKASGSGATAIGLFNQATNYGSTAIGGYSNQATQLYSVALGGYASSSIINKMAFGNYSLFSVGAAQAGTFVFVNNTTDATAEALTTNNGAAGTTNQVILPNNSAFAFSGTIVARQQASTGTASAAWKVEGLIRREGSAGTTVLVNSATTVLDNTPAWGMALTADTTNGGLAITVTGAAATNIRWVATINTSEVTY